MAKGLEDTACYVYTRFMSVNEVGGSPANFGIPLSEFHRANQGRAGALAARHAQQHLRMTPSEAKMCARGWMCCRRCPAPGLRR